KHGGDLWVRGEALFHGQTWPARSGSIRYIPSRRRLQSEECRRSVASGSRERRRESERNSRACPPPQTQHKARWVTPLPPGAEVGRIPDSSEELRWSRTAAAEAGSDRISSERPREASTGQSRKA